MSRAGPGKEDHMARSLFSRGCAGALCALFVALGSLTLAGCGDAAMGTVQVAPTARHRGTDPVSRERRDARRWKARSVTARYAEPGKLSPGRGRVSD
jgi:hypothetical protein